MCEKNKKNVDNKKNNSSSLLNNKVIHTFIIYGHCPINYNVIY